MIVDFLCIQQDVQPTLQIISPPTFHLLESLQCALQSTSKHRNHTSLNAPYRTSYQPSNKKYKITSTKDFHIRARHPYSQNLSLTENGLLTTPSIVTEPTHA
eukprot:GHVP01070670.1.p1 GENE.GHVP01070670.1~~GHVP01070670.1.p1  ORF type:complete len:102 (-),score=4.06 GHVP01070670.1:694-999(-)